MSRRAGSMWKLTCPTCTTSKDYGRTRRLRRTGTPRSTLRRSTPRTTTEAAHFALTMLAARRAAEPASCEKSVATSADLSVGIGVHLFGLKQPDFLVGGAKIEMRYGKARARRRLHFHAAAARESEHGFVVRADLADEGGIAACAAVVDRLHEERPAEAAA